MTAGDETSGKPTKIPGKERLTPPLAKRFYKDVVVKPSDGGFAILLDGRPVRTPGKLSLAVPTQALADAIAQEWAAQGELIDPATMPLSKLAITTIDGVAKTMPQVAADIVAYAGSDLLCYRAVEPEPLIRLQADAWDPVLRWAQDTLGARFVVGEGVMPVVQSPAALERIAAAVAPYKPMALTCLHVMTTLMGSALLALAHAEGRLTLEEAWAAAHVDEDWQIDRWGVDVEAAERRARRLREMQAASRFLKLLAER